MSGFFNLDNPFWRTLSRMADLIFLNLLFLLCCIPIFTIGASMTALNYVNLKLHEGQEGYLRKTFFKSFKENFKQATGIWLLMLAVGILLIVDYVIIRDISGTLFTFVKIGLFVVFILYLFEFVYVFPVLSRFVNTVKQTFKDAFIMSFVDFPRTIIMSLIFVVPVIVTFINIYTLSWGLVLWILIGFALISYLQTFFMEKVFKRYMPEEEDSDPDEWFMDEVPEEDIEKVISSKPKE